MRKFGPKPTGGFINWSVCPGVCASVRVHVHVCVLIQWVKVLGPWLGWCPLPHQQGDWCLSASWHEPIFVGALPYHVPQSKDSQIKGVNVLHNNVHKKFHILFQKQQESTSTQSSGSVLLEGWRRNTYLHFKLEVLVLPLATQDIARNTNLNGVLQVVSICSQRARIHPLSKAHWTRRTKRM